MAVIYDRIEELCKKKSINVTKLCSDCGIPRATLSDFKKGRTKTLSFKTLSKIADYFDVSVDYFSANKKVLADEDAIKVALFGGETTVTDEMWNEVKRYAEYIKERNNGNN